MTDKHFVWNKENIWLRLLYMVIIGFGVYISVILTWLLVFLQFVLTLVSGEPNTNLLKFGSGLSQYIQQGFQFLSFNSEEKPFPFQDWPSTDDKVDDASDVGGSD